MNELRQVLKDWALPIAMSLGAVSYFVLRALPATGEMRQEGYRLITTIIQPALLFLMLFFSFLKVSPRQMRPQQWHGWVLLMQAFCFVCCSGVAMLLDGHHAYKVLAEGAMLAFICPTATASAVITSKLGGNLSGIVTHLLCCNLMVSVLAPALLPLVERGQGITFFPAFLMILRRVFPLLIGPLLLAQVVRHFLPRLTHWLLSFPNLSFDLWLPSLALAIMVTVRSIMHTTVGIATLVLLAVVCALCCLLQFHLGHRVGALYDRETRITAGQAFGQKNTVFIIWLGLTFLDPVTSVVGGFYSVFHNIINSVQLFQARKQNNGV